MVVSNTSPLSNLAIIGRLDLLFDGFDKIFIPEAVTRELRNLGNRTALAEIEDAIRTGKIEIKKVHSQLVVKAFAELLDEGEAEALTLSLEQKASLLLMDELRGRSVAEKSGVKCLGVLGLLVRSRERGALSALKPELLKLRRQANFFVSRPLEEQILRAVGEL